MVPSLVTMPTLRRALILVGATTILCYGGAMAWLVAQETTIVFRASPVLGDLRPKTPFEQVTLQAPGGPRQIAFVVRGAASGATDRPWVIFLHGNASTIASRLNILHCDRLAALGLNVLAPEYRGYGGVDGVPSENGIDADARTAYDYLRQQLHADPRRIVIYGWSLGSAVAVDLAAHADEAAVVLEGAPASIVAIGQQQYPYFPIRLLIRNPFESIRKIDRIGSPVLFLHSPEDTVIPIAEGRRLFGAALQPKQFVEVSGGHVYACERDANFFPAIRAFLQARHLLP
jgi:pimeloyl-ACP methyl ester carboxylesterase